jgi:hypothetical protein
MQLTIVNIAVGPVWPFGPSPSGDPESRLDEKGCGAAWAPTIGAARQSARKRPGVTGRFTYASKQITKGRILGSFQQ